MSTPPILTACEAVGGQAEMARRRGVTPATVNQWCKDVRPVPIEHCPAIEADCGFIVRRWDLRPDDWHRIWPELVGSDGAPNVPVQAAA